MIITTEAELCTRSSFLSVCSWILERSLQTFPKSKWIQLTKIGQIPRTNICDEKFVGTLVLLQNPQRANIGNCSGFRKCKCFSVNLCKLCLQFADSAYNFRNPLRVCIPLTVAHSQPLKFTKDVYYYLFKDSTNCSGFRKLACFWSDFDQYSVLAICPWNQKQQRSKKSSNVASSTTYLILVCCRIRLQCTEGTFRPRNNKTKTFLPFDPQLNIANFVYAFFQVYSIVNFMVQFQLSPHFLLIIP